MLTKSNLARIAKIVALLLFLMPWVVVSCSPEAMRNGNAPPPMMPGAGPSGGQELARATGLQIASGTVQWRMPQQPQQAPASAQEPAKPWSAPDMPALAGALLILLSLAASFLIKGRTGALAAAVGSLLAACALYYSVMIAGRAAVQAYFSAAGQGSSGGGGPSAADIARMIAYEVQTGFWLVLVALAAAVVLNVLAMQGSTAPAAAATPEPPAG